MTESPDVATKATGRKSKTGGIENVARRRGVLTLGSAALVIGMVASACSNATNSTSGPASSTAPGVTKNSIIVGSLATASGPLSGQFGQIVDGVQAYLDAVDSEGGVDGRKIYLKYRADDTGSPTDDTTQARNLVEQDHVFAVVGVATPFFSGSSFFATEGTPAFGYTVSTAWNDAPDLFAAYGSYLNYSQTQPGQVYLAKALKAKSVAVVAYNIAAESEDACASTIKGLKAAGIHVGFQDLNFGLGANPTADVLAMKAAHVDLLSTCLEGTDNLAFAQAMDQNGMSGVHAVWLNGYDRSFLEQDPAAMVGVVYVIQHVPFEAASQFPGKYPAMEQYLRTMKKYEPNAVYNDLAFQGYVNAAQFVQGLREEAATHKSLTQANLIAAINKETAFTAGGLIPPVDWKVAHTSTPLPYCSALVEVEAKDALKVVFVQKDDQVFGCLNLQGHLVAPPSGTPGT
jgi:ABC-type branched-subunit amino acid transport system substrate-binding protein